MIAVVGAGLAGVTAARTLAAAGRAVTLFDKSPRVGGRLATRRVERPDGTTVRFDHGCQYLSATGRAFAAELGRLTAAGVLAEWPDPPAGLPPKAGGKPWLVAPGGMRSVVEHLAAGLPTRTATAVTRVTFQDHSWTVISNGQAAAAADWLVLTPPVPQALRLLFDSGFGLPRDLLWRLREVEYTRCLTLLAADPRDPRPADPTAVEWVADNHAKGVSPAGPAWTVHFSPAASEREWDAPAATLAAAAFTPVPDGVQLHRWRYCRPLTPYPDRCAAVPDLRLVLAGDGFGTPGGTAETAYLSGLAAAAAVLEGA